MRKYEVIFIVRPLEDEATEAVIEKFSKLIANNGGTIDKEDRWGRAHDREVGRRRGRSRQNRSRA